MTRKSLIPLFMSAALSATGQAAPSASDDIVARIALTFDDKTVVVGLFDSDASRDLLAQLPLSLTFSDFAGAEKIAYPPKALSLADTPLTAQIAADFAYYPPWKNIAVFYKGQGSDGRLYALGRIESGKDKLAEMKRDFSAVIEKID